MKKRVSFLLAIVLLLSVLTGCGGKKELDPQTLADDLLQNAEFTDSLSQLDPAVVAVLYGTDPADYDAVLSYAGTGATAEEITVFTAKDSAAADRLLTLAQDHVSARVEAFKNYGPGSAMSLEDAVVKKSGNHVVVIVCSDTKGAAKIADKYI